MKWITAGDIKSWASSNQRDCISYLPELLRRLILASAESVEEIIFPSGDGVSTSGWDGILSTQTSSTFFPQGCSGWEFGTDTSPGVKAQDDYSKRTSNPLTLTANQTTFVFVTPRPWPQRKKWASDKTAEHKWKEVKTIGADDLEAWLEQTPAVGFWLAKHLGKTNGSGVRSLEDFWEEWSAFTNPPLSPQLVIAGRDKQSDEVNKWLNTSPGILSLQGDSSDEPFAFLYCVINALPLIKRDAAYSRTLYIEKPDELRQVLSTFRNPLILALTAECTDLAALAVKKGHHVFIGFAENVTSKNSHLRLSRPFLSHIRDGLKEIGLKEIEANKLARDSGRSIPVLRRRMSQAEVFVKPLWVSQESAEVLLPLLLLGAWNEKKLGDQQIIRSLSEQNYDEYTKKALHLLGVADSPLRKIGNVWMLKSQIDTWFLLAEYISDSLLNKYQQVLMGVLLTSDPKFELPPDQRWASAVYGKIPQHSTWLREGLCNSLAMIAVFGDRAVNVTSLQEVINRIVTDIVRSITSWELWASLDDICPLLADAAPDAFINEVSLQIQKNPATFITLLRDSNDSPFGECNHSGLLWALESLAWSSQYFSRSVEVLKQLALIDPGGRYANRPANSLADIFMPLWPQTYASPEQRITSLDKFVSSSPVFTWNFTKSYHSGGGFTEAYRFRWRDYESSRSGFEQEAEPARYQGQLLIRLEALACHRDNLVDAMSDFHHMPVYIQTALIKTLNETDLESFTAAEVNQLYSHIRESMGHINDFGDENERKNLPFLEKLLSKFTPTNIFERVNWLLDNPWPRLPEGRQNSKVEKSESLSSLRLDAAREVLNTTPLEEVIQYAAKMNYPGILGHALGSVVSDQDEDIRVFIFLITHALDNRLLIAGYSEARTEAVGKDWIKQRLTYLKQKQVFTPQIGAKIYLGLPEGEETWKEVEKEGVELEDEYWRYASGHAGYRSNDLAQIAVEKLLKVKRASVALSLAGGHNTSLPSKLLQELIVQYLTNLEQNKSQKVGSMELYDFANVFRQLHERHELTHEEIAKLEWPFAALLKEMSSEVKSAFSIHTLLEEDPAFFSDLIGMIYKRDDKKNNPKHEGLTSDQSHRQALQAKHVLDSWFGFPGQNEDGTVDEKKLHDWIKVARKICIENSLLTGCDLVLADILARTPTDTDGCWPHITARKVIEELDSEVINKHMQTYVYNSRGVTTRGPYDGGEQERTLSNKYRAMSEKLETEWPVTSRILRELAQSYERDATREDLDAQLHEIRWG